MTDDHEGHGDATLDVIALLEAAIKDDGHGYDVLLEGVLASDHLSHVLGTIVGILADQLASHHGKDGALQVLAGQRGHALGTPQCDHEHDPLGGDDLSPPDRIGFEVSEVAENVAKLASSVEDGLEALGDATVQNGAELAALTRAVERLGDILDKRLA